MIKKNAETIIVFFASVPKRLMKTVTMRVERVKWKIHKVKVIMLSNIIHAKSTIFESSSVKKEMW